MVEVVGSNPIGSTEPDTSGSALGRFFHPLLNSRLACEVSGLLSSMPPVCSARPASAWIELRRRIQLTHQESVAGVLSRLPGGIDRVELETSASRAPATPAVTAIGAIRPTGSSIRMRGRRREAPPRRDAGEDARGSRQPQPDRHVSRRAGVWPRAHPHRRRAASGPHGAQLPSVRALFVRADLYRVTSCSTSCSTTSAPPAGKTVPTGGTDAGGDPRSTHRLALISCAGWSSP
jgi:hypothetical protein